MKFLVPMALAACLSMVCSDLAAGPADTAPTTAPATPESPCRLPPESRLLASHEEIRCLLDSGHAARALIHAQRLAAEFPNDGTARSLLAEALAALNARPEALAIPPAPGEREPGLWDAARDAVQSKAWLSLAAGYDSNINRATPLEVVPVPLLNYRSLVLDPLMIRRASPFVGLAAGVVAAKPLSGTLALAARGSASLRLNSAEASYLPHGYQGEVVLRRRGGDTEIDLAADFQQDWIAGYRLVSRTGLTARIAHTVRAGVEFEAAASESWNRYPQFNDVKTVLMIGSVAARHLGSGLWFMAQSGSERASGEIRDLDRNITGFSLGWNRPLWANGALQARLGETRSEYLLPSPLFARQRLDTVREFLLAYQHRLSDHWTVTPSLLVERNDSSIPLISFRRQQVWIELRRVF